METLKTFVEKGNKFVVAHRGVSKHAPENTMSAFKLTIDSGAAMLEVDVQSTSDGVIVTWHDDNLKHLLGIDAKISEMTYEELCKIDAGSWFSNEFKGEKIPRFDQVLELILNKLYLNIEIKEPKVPESKLLTDIINIVEKYNYLPNSIFCSFYYNLLPTIKFDCYDANIAAIRIPGDKLKPSVIREKFGIDAFICDISEVDEELRFDAVENNIFLGVYGLLDEKSIEKAIEHKVAAFASDDPELIFNELRKRKIL